MSGRIAIELNDSGIVVTNGVQLLCDSPGYAIETAEGCWVGKEARDRAMLMAQHANNRFWRALSQAQSPTLDVATTRQAMQHMNTIWSRVSRAVDDVILAVPATFTKTGLGLLLGICNELSIPVRAMVHNAVLSPRQRSHSGTTIHVEVQLHQTAITILREEDQAFSVGKVEIIDDLGLDGLYADAITTLAPFFIHATRLDPLHSADTEQQLFNALPSWLQDAWTQDVVHCRLHRQGQLHEVDIEAEVLRRIGRRFCKSILNSIHALHQEEDAIVCIPAYSGHQLGFADVATRNGVNVRFLEHGYHAHRAWQRADDLLGHTTQIYLIKQLPFDLTQLPFRACMLSESVSEEAATHVLFRDRAYSISAPVYVLKTSGRNYELCTDIDLTNRGNRILTISEHTIHCRQSQNLLLNDRMMPQTTTVKLGDRIHLPGCADELQFIRVS